MPPNTHNEGAWARKRREVRERNQPQSSTFEPSERILEAYEGLGEIDFEAFRGELAALAQGLTSEIFGPGGPVEQASGQALRGSVATGFGPRSGGYTAARQNILRSATDHVGNRIAQGAMQIAPLALQRAESRFGGAASIEGLRLSEEQLRQNQRIIDQMLQQSGCGIGDRLGAGLSGGLTGAAAGSFIPGIGNIAGGILGGLSGLFGGC